MQRLRALRKWWWRAGPLAVLGGGWLYLHALPVGEEPSGMELFKLAQATPTPAPKRAGSPVQQIAANPLAYIERIRTDYDRRIRDYTCMLTKQELLAGGLTEEQVAHVKFREGPFSVFMHMLTNPDRVRRVLYVRNRLVENGLEEALIEPESAIARLFVNSVRRPIHGTEARQASRRTIDEFGFANTLDLLIKYARMSAEAGRLDLRFTGVSEIDGRPTYVFERRLPRHEDPERWPDSLLIVHIDQEWELPVACYSYADADGRSLLGKYIYTDITLNVGLQPADFEPSTYGM